MSIQAVWQSESVLLVQVVKDGLVVFECSTLHEASLFMLPF